MNYGIIGVVLVVIVIWFLAKRRERKIKGSIDYIEDFIAQEPDRSSIRIVQNGDVLRDHQSSKLFPIAGIYQMIIAIEYAERVSNGNLDPDEVVYFDQLDNFYVPKSDGGAHMAWFKSISRNIEEDGIPLKEVVRGMLNYDSMANTEWLCQKIDLVNINKRLEKLDFLEHKPINYPVSSLFIGYERFQDLKGEELQDALKAMTDDDYLASSAQIHNKLAQDPSYKSTLPEVGFDAQKIWSDRLTASTTMSYQELMSRLNSKNFFEEKVSEILTALVENIMTESSASKWLKHAGKKSTSSAYALSQVLYATDLEGNKTEMAMFFDNLSLQENSKLLRAIQAFELKILSLPRKK